MLLLGVLSCQKKRTVLPISEETLVPILKDIQIAESIIQQQNYIIKDSLTERYYGVIYRTYDIDPSDLDSTLAILRKDPAMMDKIYTKVLEELSKEEVQD